MCLWEIGLGRWDQLSWSLLPPLPGQDADGREGAVFGDCYIYMERVLEGRVAWKQHCASVGGLCP